MPFFTVASVQERALYRAIIKKRNYTKTVCSKSQWQANHLLQNFRAVRAGQKLGSLVPMFSCFDLPLE